MRALINLKSHTNWAKLYFDAKNPMTIKLNECSLIQNYFDELVEFGITIIDIQMCDEFEDEIYLRELAKSRCIEVNFLKKDRYIHSDKSYELDLDKDYSLIIQGAISLPSRRIMKKMINRQKIYLGEYRDNIGGISFCLLTLSDFFQHMLKCIKPIPSIRNNKTEVINTIFAEGIEVGKELYLKNKIILKNRIIDPVNSFYLHIEDSNIIKIKA